MNLTRYQLQREIKVANEAGALRAEVADDKPVNGATCFVVGPFPDISAERVQQPADTLRGGPAIGSHAIRILRLIDALAQHFPDHPVRADSKRATERSGIETKRHDHRREARPEYVVQRNRATLADDAWEGSDHLDIFIEPTGHGVKVNEGAPPRKEGLVDFVGCAPPV